MPALHRNQLCKQYLVDNAGEIDFPVIGRLQVGGLTKNAAETLSVNSFVLISKKYLLSLYVCPTTKFLSSVK